MSPTSYTNRTKPSTGWGGRRGSSQGGNQFLELEQSGFLLVEGSDYGRIALESAISTSFTNRTPPSTSWTVRTGV